MVDGGVNLYQLMLAKKMGRRGDATSTAVEFGNHHTTLVCQATQVLSQRLWTLKGESLRGTHLPNG